MELVRGADLISYVNGSPERARRALTQLARAVRYLHQRKMLHRDSRLYGAGIVDQKSDVT